MFQTAFSFLNLIVGICRYLFQRSNTLHNFQQTGTAQIDHTFLISNVHNIHFCTMVHNDTLHFLADRHNLIDTGTPLITLAPTAVATNRTVELLILCKVFICKTRLLQRRNRRTYHFLFTTRAQSPQQALRHNQADRTGNIKRRNTHIQHT